MYSSQQSVDGHARACSFPNNCPLTWGIWGTSNTCSLGPPESITQTTSGTVRLLLHRSRLTLEQRRHLSRLTMLYNHLVDTDFTSQLTLRQSSTRGHASRFLQPQCSCAAYSNSFLPRTVRDWNTLAVDPLLFQTVDAFKNYLFTDPSFHHFRF